MVGKGRDSGMPAAELWESYFDADGILDSLDFRRSAGLGAKRRGCTGFET